MRWSPNITCPRLIFQYLSVGHPPYYKGLDYIYEDRGEVNKQTPKYFENKIVYMISVYLTRNIKLYL